MCLSVRGHISKTKWPNFTKFFMHVAFNRGSVFLYPRCDMLCTSGCVDDVVFAWFCIVDAKRAYTQNDSPGKHQGQSLMSTNCDYVLGL